ncbi:MAG: helix-turn-helix domain-containing protein [Oscillospiraceae bacterium]
MNIDYREVGRRMAKRRKELGLKQYQVCEIIDVNYKYISNLETGRSAPSLEVLMDLCQALKTTPNYLLIGTDENISNEKLTEKISRLDGKSKLILNDIIDTIKKYE